jgi:two-component system chemotaxis response regulator CheB
MNGGSMPNRDLVVIGASAGGIQALLQIIRALPADFPAAICVVVHTPPYSVSRLPQILDRAGSLPALNAQNGAPLRPGRIYVAPPNYHLLVRAGFTELSRGPRENHSRPAVDPLFRSAARAYGQRVIGVILSGALYDGAMGLLAVKSRGGVAIVQDPDEAMVDSMPRSALRHVEADYVLPAPAIAAVVNQLAREPAPTVGEHPMVDSDERMGQSIATDIADQAADQRSNEVTIYTCPDCGGVTWQEETGSVVRFRCHVGHAYAPEVMLSLKSEELESALWASVRLLTEKATLTRQLANRARSMTNESSRERVAEQAALDERHAQVIRDLLLAMPSPTDQATVIAEAIFSDENPNGDSRR